MDLNVDDFLNNLLTEEAHNAPSDDVKNEEDLELLYPEWYDEKLFNRARKFYWEYCFSLTTSMLTGLVAVFSVPSILKILVKTRRSNSKYTSYKRYLSTVLHTVTWFEHELKPGSTSWKSLEVVRRRHFRAGLASIKRGVGTVSQRDMALTQFGFIGFVLLKPQSFGIRPIERGDWEAFNHFWRVIGYMIGIKDKYNICRSTVEESREVCLKLQERVFTPCLENVPEYFEHLSRVMLEGMWHVNPTLNVNAFLYWVRYLADVPGYVYDEPERQAIQDKIKKALNGAPVDVGVPTTSLIQNCALDGLPAQPPRLLYYHDYDTLNTVPGYRKLTCFEKFNLNHNILNIKIYDTYLGRLYFNLNFLWSLILMKYCPFLAFFTFGIKKSLVNIFKEDPVDNTEPIVNAEYYKSKPSQPWYRSYLPNFW